MASSSSSHKEGEGHTVLNPRSISRKVEESVRLYDVFINHRGPDVKETLALRLYVSLEKLGIRAFLDSEEKNPGVSFPSTIKTAIESARVHIAIFSRGYAESPWCLEELRLMLKTEAKIIPLFHEVEPWELRHIEKGSYGDAFKNYEEKNRFTKMLGRWKEALEGVSYVAGYVIKDSHTSGECKEIVSAVRKEIQKIIKLQVAKYPVGLSKLVQELERRCLSDLLQNVESQYWINEDGQRRARIVGIYGMGGTGKTTLSKELFNAYISKYTRASFLFDVREASARGALPSLQLKLLRDLFEEDHPSFTSTGEGISCLQNRLGRIKYANFLIVLDDIDDLKQLDDLLVSDMLNKPGNSLLIVTTRDAGVLRRAGIPTHNLEGLDPNDARELFCLHAFGESNPARGYENLVEAFVKECGRLPLSLQVLGSHVKGHRDQKYWNSALRKVRKTLPQQIKEKLKISFDSLDGEEKEVSMDIACFFVGSSKNVAMKIWEGSGWEAHHALETLKDKCLVQEIESKYAVGLKWEWDNIDLGMHDHLRDLGRDLANECCCRRIWQPQALKSLEAKGGFRNIIDGMKGRCFHSLFDKSMGSQITYFLAESDDWGETSASLLWLQLDLKTLVHHSIPSWIPLQKLEGLRIRNGRLQRLWESHQVPSQLKELQISESLLEEVPDLGQLYNLESVALDEKFMAVKGWSLLESLRMNMSTPHRSLIIRNFQQSTKVPLNKSPMRSVEYLEIANQKSVTNTLISGNYCTSLKTVKLHSMESLIYIDLFRVQTLNSLNVGHCENLKMLASSRCPELQELFLTQLTYLEIIRVGNCQHVKSVSGISDVRKLVIIKISQCHKLQDLSLLQLNSLETIRIEDCQNLKRVVGVSNLAKLVELNISFCPELESRLCFPSHCCLESIKVNGCRKLKYLELIGCKNVKTISGIEDLAELTVLKIQDCPALQQLSDHNLSWRERIIIDGCEKLNSRAFCSLLDLKIVTFDIGRAVEQAETVINQIVFSEAEIGADTVTEMDLPCPTIDQTSVSKIVICGLVVAERSTPLQYVNYRSHEFHLGEGRWIVTMVISDPKRKDTRFISTAVERMCYGRVERGFRVTLIKGQECITRQVLQTIDANLYQK